MGMFSVRKDQRLALSFLKAWAAPLGRDLNGWSQRHLAMYMARCAIFHALAAMRLKRGDRVLAPAYICRAAIEPILAYGAAVDFYRIDRRCRFTISDLEIRMTPATKAVLAVHYFGFPSDPGVIQEFCRRHGIYFIEDCAHVLEGQSAGRPLGSFGDVSVFSWRKFLPIPDGADLVLGQGLEVPMVNWEGETPFRLARNVKHSLEDMFECSGDRWLRPLVTWWKVRGVGHDTGGAGGGMAVLSGDGFDSRVAQWRMSRVSQWIKAHSDIPAVVQSRRRNYLGLRDRLRQVPGIQILHDELPDGVCPWVLPVVFEGQAEAHRDLRERGIPAVTWGGVIPESLPLHEYPDAEYLYERLVFLPVHQSLTESDLDRIASVSAQVRARD